MWSMQKYTVTLTFEIHPNITEMFYCYGWTVLFFKVLLVEQEKVAMKNGLKACLSDCTLDGDVAYLLV